ncbi:uncharacterized protein TNCV_2120991 [Trichonephila clavipes]|nr:uncharacterized protein TNCV_2120991 [Trichonephila clavipes]
MLYDVAWSESDFGCQLVEENSILLVCAAKVRLLKLRDTNHKREADQPNPTHAEWATYSANKQAKEVSCVELNRNLKQSLQHVGVHYPAER